MSINSKKPCRRALELSTIEKKCPNKRPLAFMKINRAANAKSSSSVSLARSAPFCNTLESCHRCDVPGKF